MRTLLKTLRADLVGGRYYFLGVLIASVFLMVYERVVVPAAINFSVAVGGYLVGCLVAHLILVVIFGREEWRQWNDRRSK